MHMVNWTQGQVLPFCEPCRPHQRFGNAWSTGPERCGCGPQPTRSQAIMSGRSELGGVRGGVKTCYFGSVSHGQVLPEAALTSRDTPTAAPLSSRNSRRDEVVFMVTSLSHALVYGTIWTRSHRLPYRSSNTATVP